MSALPYKKRKSRIGLLFGILLVVAVVAGGGLWAFQAFSTTEKKSLSVGLTLEPTNLDIRRTSGVALEQVFLDNVYEGLLGLKEGSLKEFEPKLAQSLPQISEDGKRYVFHVRPNVVFHSGQPLRDEDVVASLQEGLTEKALGSSARVSSPSPREIVIELDEPNNQLLWILAGKSGIILEKNATNDLANSANGTGPFRFGSWKRGNSITLEKNPQYWGDGAALDSVEFKFYKDAHTAAQAVKEKSLDVLTVLSPMLRGDFDGDSERRMFRAESTDVFTLVYNMRQDRFQDARLREALSLAIDSTALIVSQNGDGRPLGGPITQLEPGYEDLTAVNAHNPERARELLREVGAENMRLTLTVPNHYDMTVPNILVSQLQEVGVTLEVQRVEFSTWLDRVYTAHDFDLSYVDHAEALDIKNYANPSYYFGYDNPEVQRLYAESRAALDTDTADERLRALARVIANDAPAKWLYNYTPTVVMQKTVHNFPTRNTNARIPLGHVHLDS